MKKKKKLPTKNSMSGKSVFQKWINIFPDKQKLREMIPVRLDLQKVLKRVLQVEINGC